MTLIIRTNNQPRNLLSWDELTLREQAELPYTGAIALVSDYVRYKGWVYNLSDTMGCSADGWNGMECESYFSGVLFKFVGGNEQVICATYRT